MEKIDINQYLKEARRKAKIYGYDGDLKLSEKKDKKLKFTDKKTGKIIHFGAKNYNDKIIYEMLYDPKYAYEKSKSYRSRASSIFKKSDFLSPSALSWYVLW